MRVICQGHHLKGISNESVVSASPYFSFEPVRKALKPAAADPPEPWRRQNRRHRSAHWGRNHLLDLPRHRSGPLLQSRPENERQASLQLSSKWCFAGEKKGRTTRVLRVPFCTCSRRNRHICSWRSQRGRCRNGRPAS